jgi:WD40 repeat protein
MRQRFAFAWSAILGYDIFISYRRTDGSAYAEKLWRDLKSAGLTPFLDRDETPGGAHLTPTLVRALRKSRMLVVLLTPDVLDSEWVQQEVETFATFTGRAIVPINIDNYIGRHNLGGTRLARLKEYSWIEETREGLETGVPSQDVLTEIAKGFRKVRVRSISRVITSAVMVALAVAAVTTFIQMRRAQHEARVALAAQTAAQAELIETQDHAQIDLAASLAFDSLQRSPSLQAERAIRAGLESLPIQVASITVGDASDIGFARDGTDILALSKDGRKVVLHGQPNTPPREVWSCAAAVPCTVFVRAGVALTATARAAGGSTIRLVDIMNGAQRAGFEWDAEPATLLTNETAHVIAAVDAAGRACIWRVEGTPAPVCIDGPAGATWGLNRNGHLLASRLEDEDDDDKVVTQVWSVETGAEVLRTGGTLYMSSTGQFAATTSGNTYVRVYELPEGTPLPDFHHGETIGGVLFDPTDRLMATWSYDYQLRLWAFEVERPQVPVAIGQAGRQGAAGLTGFTDDSLGIVTVAGNPSGGSDVLIWRPRVRDRDRSLVPKQLLRHDSGVRAVVAHRDGTTYATLDDKGVARVWDTRDGNAASVSYVDSTPPEEPAASCRGGTHSTWFGRLWPRSKVVEGGPDPKDAEAVDPCGAFFAVVTKNASVGRDPEILTVYSTATRQEVTRIEHAANMNSAAFSGDGRYLVTGGEDHLIRVFDLLDNQQVASIEMETEVHSVRFTADDRYIVAVGTDELLGRIPVVNWRWKPADLLEAMKARRARRLSRDEWSRFLGAEPPLVPAAFVVQ